MTRIDLTKGQCTALAAYLRGKVTSHVGVTYDDVELWVLAVRALELAEELPEERGVPPVPPPKAIAAAPLPLPTEGAMRKMAEPVVPATKPEAPPAATKRGAPPTAEFKRATLERLTAYRGKGGLTSLAPLAALCGEADGKRISAEMLARMLNREKMSINVWRAVSAGLDKMDKKNGGANDGKDD